MGVHAAMNTQKLFFSLIQVVYALIQKNDAENSSTMHEQNSLPKLYSN